MEHFESYKLKGTNQVITTKHGEIIFGRIIEETESHATIEDDKNEIHKYPWHWIDLGIHRNYRVNGTPYNSYGRKAKKLIIVGAGASHDFSPDPKIENRPPLSNSLFSNDHFDLLKRAYFRVQVARNDLADQNNLEKRIYKIYERAKSKQSLESVWLLNELVFYFSNLFILFSYKHTQETRNNYLTLLVYLKEYLEDNPDQEIIIINFNYDLILDNAIEKSFGIKYGEINDYLGNESSRIKMFKVHGSCNWVRHVLPLESGEFGIHNTNRNLGLNDLPGLFERKKLHPGIIQNNLSEDITILKDGKFEYQPPYIRTGEEPIFPHLLLPFQEKDDFMMPYNHVKLLEKSLRDIDEVLTIGWKGEEKALQKIFLEHASSVKKLTIVDYTERESDFNLKNFIFQDTICQKHNLKPEIYARGFSNYARALSNEELSIFESNLSDNG